MGPCGRYFHSRLNMKWKYPNGMLNGINNTHENPNMKMLGFLF